jgi:hypothetical protein
MEEVDPLHLTPGESYYLDKPDSKVFTDSRGLSSRGKGEFVKYEEGWTGAISAKFKNIESVNNKPFYFLPDSQYRPNESTFHVAPYKSMYNIYKPLPQGFIDSYREKDKELRVKAVENMINSQFPYPKEDVISTGNMFAEEPFYVRPPSYEETPQKTNIGTQLSTQISKYFGGRRRRKTRKSRKSRKSRKTKSRRRR